MSDQIETEQLETEGKAAKAIANQQESNTEELLRPKSGTATSSPGRLCSFHRNKAFPNQRD